MSTQAQIDANRRNAQKSTGPKTEEGKRNSSKNRLSHGFNSEDPILPGENQEDFDALLEALADEYKPATVTENMLVEKMAIHQWFSLRAIRLQVEAFKPRLKRAHIGEDGNLAIPPKLGLLIRYHNSSDRNFLRMRAELLTAQKQRENQEIGFVPSKPAEPQPVAAPEPAPEPTQQPDFAPRPAPEPIETAPNLQKMAA